MSNTENKDENIISLHSNTGEKIDFVEIAVIAHKGGYYVILQPVELLPGMSDDEALVFKLGYNNDGSDKYEIELDDEIIDAVFEKYSHLYDESTKK